MNNLDGFDFIEPSELTEEVVAQYLTDNPDFFQQKSGLVEKLRVPHKEVGAVSLVEVQLDRLRGRVCDLEEEITQLMSVAAENDRIFHFFMELQSQLLGCDDLDQAQQVLSKNCKQINLSSYLSLFSHADEGFILNLKRFIKSNFNGRDAYLGRLRNADRTALFGAHSSPEFGSFAILPIGQPVVGMIAFASGDGGHFQPSMDTVFLRQLSSTLSHLSRVWRERQDGHNE